MANRPDNNTLERFKRSIKTSKESAERDPLKIVVFGDMSTGKSAMMRRFVHNLFASQHASTIGADFVTFTVDVSSMRADGKVRDDSDYNQPVQIWDTAGQERFHSLSRAFYRNAHVGIVLFDVSKQSTFSSVSQWLKQFYEGSDELTPCLLVGNKSDIDERFYTDVDAEVRAPGKLIGFQDYVEISAKKDENVTLAFYTAIRIALEYMDKQNGDNDTQKDGRRVPYDYSGAIDREMRSNKSCAC